MVQILHKPLFSNFNLIQIIFGNLTLHYLTLHCMFFIKIYSFKFSNSSTPRFLFGIHPLSKFISSPLQMGCESGYAKISTIMPNVRHVSLFCLRSIKLAILSLNVLTFRCCVTTFWVSSSMSMKQLSVSIQFSVP